MKYAFIFAFFGVLVLLNLIYGDEKYLQSINLKGSGYNIEAYKTLHKTYIKAYVFNSCQLNFKSNNVDIDLYNVEFQKKLIDFIRKDLACVQKQ